MTHEDENAEIRQNVEDVDLAYVARIVRHGTMLKVAIREGDARFYRLQPGDRVHVKIDRVERRQPGER